MSSEKKFKCEYEGCDKTYKNKSGLRHHLANIHHINCKFYYCQKCSFKTTRGYSLKLHINNRHSYTKKIKKYYCFFCKKHFLSKDERDKHETSEHSDEDIIWYKCDQEGCDKIYKNKISLKKHILVKHTDSKIWYNCDKCDSKFPLKESLKQHILFVHTDKYIQCDLCDKKVKTQGGLKSHKKHIHNISVTWFKCDLCDHKSKTKSALTKHKSDIHHIGLVWIKCQKCNYKCKNNSQLNTHVKLAHIIKENIYKCNICNKLLKTSANLKSHITNVHNTIFNKFECNLCDKKLKNKTSLKQHLANIHDIGVVYHYCPEENCFYRSKLKSDLNTHLQKVHDIGKHPCDFCLGNRNSSITYKDSVGSHKICRACYNKATGKNSRIEHTWSDYLDKVVGTEYLLSSDKSLKSVGGCSLRRPDKLYTGPHLTIVAECDEQQHLYNNGSYECEDKRLSEIYDEPGISGKKMAVIRWNPDHYIVPEGCDKALRKDRLKTCSDLIKRLMKKPPKDLITVYYLFYNEDNPRISQAYPVEMIY